MKKQLFIGLAALGLLASCSNDEIVEQSIAPQAAIGFDGAFVNNSTRATGNDILNEAIFEGGFSVYGTMFNPTDESSAVAPIFVNQSVTYSNSTRLWSYTPLRYWTPKNNYSFSAFAPTTNAKWAFTDDADNTNYLTPHGTVAFNNADGNQDFGYAFSTRENAKNNETPVELAFDHMLSKVNVKFLNSFETPNATLTITNLQIVSANGGEFDLSQLPANYTNTNLQNAKWTFDGYTANGLTVNYTFANTSGASVATSQPFSNSGNATTDNFFFLMPSQESITVKFRVELFSNGVSNGYWDHTVDVSLSENGALVFKPGCSYTLVASINAQNVADEALNPIEFTAKVNNWEDDADVNIPLLGLNATETTLAVGGTFQITPNTTCGSLVQGTGYTVAYTYASADDAVATVSTEGLITGVAAGETTVTVTGTITKTSGAVFTRSKDVDVTVQ